MENLARTVAMVLCGLLGAGLLVVGALAWRLGQGPIPLDLLTPRLEAALAAADGSMRAELGATSLEWDPHDRDLDVRVRDVRILGPGGELRASLPTVAVGIAPGALLLGSVVPRTLEVIGPRLHLAREQDGRLAVGVGNEPATATAQLLAAGLTRRQRTRGPHTIRVRDGEVQLDDGATGTTWRATGLALTARRDAGGIVLERLAFDVDPTSVMAAGTIRDGTADLELTLARLPTRALERWWPASIAPALRDLVVTHVSGGGITSARVTLRASLTGDAAPRLALGSVAGRAVFGGLDVRSWADLPPAAGVGGLVTFSSQGWRVRLARGAMDGVDIVRAVVQPGPVGGAPGIRLEGALRAPLSKVLALLERPRLRAVANFPFRPGEISGGATANVLVAAPLEGGTVQVRAHGDLRSVSLRRAFRGRNVNARRLQFDLGTRAFRMGGEVSVGRTPLRLRWRESFGRGTPDRRMIVVKGRLDEEGRKALGVDLGSWIEGPIDLQTRLLPRGTGSAMDVLVDLTPAALDLPLLNLQKDAGAPGRATARLALSDGRVSAVDDFRLHAAGSAIEGRALFDRTESWRSAEGTILVPPRSVGSAPATIDLVLAAAGTSNQLTVTADDAGVAWRAVDSYADTTGGALKLTGEIRLGVPGMPFTGTVEAERFVLTRSPMIAKIAAMGPVGGLIDALSGAGLPFSQLFASFTQRAGVITISEGIGAGPGMAITVRGTVDRPRDDLSLEGMVVPNYDGLNKLVKDAPAATFASFGGEAIPALDFSVSGSLADPYVSATPATAIAPAVVRDMLRLTTAGAGRPRKGRGAAAGGVEDEIEPGSTPRRRKGATRTRAEAKPEETKPKVRRRVRAAPSAPGTGIE